MEQDNKKLPDKSGGFILSATLPGWWFLPQTWQSLVMSCLGTFVMVILVCSAPLFSEVATTVGLYNVLKGSPSIGVQVQTNVPSDSFVRNLSYKITDVVTHDIGDYIDPTALFLLQTPRLNILAKKNNAASDRLSNLVATSDQIVLDSGLSNQIAQQLVLQQGKFPHASYTNLEIMVTSSMAKMLGIQVGSLIPVSLPSNEGTIIWYLRVVGIFAPRIPTDTYWQGMTFQPELLPTSTLYRVLTTSDALLSMFTHNKLNIALPFVITQNYLFSNSYINVDELYNLAKDLQIFEQDVPNSIGSLPAVQNAVVVGTIIYTLPQYITQFQAANIPVLLILTMIIGISIFFIAVLSAMSLERCKAFIALLNSRGATPLQIFGIFLLQDILISFLSCLLCPLIAIYVVRLVVTLLLPIAYYNVLNNIFSNYYLVISHILGFALLSAAMAMVSMAIALWRALKTNIVTIRRDAARDTRPPIWLRLHLDIIVSILILASYVEYLYVASSFIGKSQILLGLFSLLFPILMPLAGLLLFQRCLPVILKYATRLVLRARGIIAPFTLVQMERSPQAASRMIMLLAVTTIFMIFAQVFVATQQQRIKDVVDYQVGADFSGTFLPLPGQQNLSDLINTYLRIPGVVSASVGYRTSTVGTDGTPIQIFAVDPHSFARTLFWSSEDAQQPLSSFMSLLVQKRSSAIANNVVYAIVDESLWNTLHLSVGAPFTLLIPGFTETRMHYIAIGKVQHIPGVYDQLPDGSGFIVDYQSYAAVYKSDTGFNDIAPNSFWIQTSRKTSSLQNVRRLLQSPTLQISVLQDRQAMLEAAQSDPLQIDIASILILGITFVGVQALICICITGWHGISERILHLTILRSFGTTIRQITAILLCEQFVVYCCALLLGVILGMLLTTVVVPVIAFTNVSGGANTVATFNVPPLHVVIPLYSILLTFGIMLLVCCIVLWVSAMISIRISASYILRLNED